MHHVLSISHAISFHVIFTTNIRGRFKPNFIDDLNLSSEKYTNHKGDKCLSQDSNAYVVPKPMILSKSN